LGAGRRFDGHGASGEQRCSAQSPTHDSRLTAPVPEFAPSGSQRRFSGTIASAATERQSNKDEASVT
jgi:hypothetical protein